MIRPRRNARRAGPRPRFASPPRTTAALALVALGTGLAVAPSCTLIVASEASQCSTDDDCTAKAGFENSVCRQGLCVDKPQCAVTSDCGDPNLACNAAAGRCVALTDENCPLVSVYGATGTGPAAIPNNSVIVGVMGDVTDIDQNYVFELSYFQGARLARDQFAENLPPAAFFQNRPVVLVGCRQVAPAASTDHLVALGAKAILGPPDPATFAPAATRAVGAKVPVFNPWVTSNTALSIGGVTNLVWITTALEGELFTPLNALIAAQEKAIRATKGADYKVRVWLAVSTLGSRKEFVESARTKLVFNGKSAVENQNDPGCEGGSCFAYEYDEITDGKTAAKIAKDVKAFKPDIVVPYTDTEFTTLIYYIEEDPADPNYRSTIRYVHPFLQIEEPGYLDGVSGLRQPWRATGFRDLRGPRYDAFVSAFQDAYIQKSPVPGGGHGYETMWLVLYSAYRAAVDARAAGASDFTAEALGAAVPNIVARNPADFSSVYAAGKTADIEANGADVGSALNQIEQGHVIKLHGIFTDFDFSSVTLNAIGSWEQWCVTKPAAGGQATFIATGATFAPGMTDFTPLPGGSLPAECAAPDASGGSGGSQDSAGSGNSGASPNPGGAGNKGGAQGVGGAAGAVGTSGAAGTHAGGN